MSNNNISRRLFLHWLVWRSQRKNEVKLVFILLHTIRQNVSYYFFIMQQKGFFDLVQDGYSNSFAGSSGYSCDFHFCFLLQTICSNNKTTFCSSLQSIHTTCRGVRQHQTNCYCCERAEGRPMYCQWSSTSSTTTGNFFEVINPTSIQIASWKYIFSLHSDSF